MTPFINPQPIPRLVAPEPSRFSEPRPPDWESRNQNADPPCLAAPSSPLDPPLSFEAIAQYANGTIRHKVTRLVGHFGFTAQDREDLESDLRTHLISKLPSFRPERGARTSFVAQVVINRVRSIIAARKAAKRCQPVGPSLDESFEDEDGNQLNRADAIDHDIYLLTLGRASRPARESFELSLDLGRAIERLPSDLADLCRRLAVQSIREICDETGIPKSTLHYRLVRIRRIFEKQGLRGYLRGCPSFSRPRR